MNYLQAVPIVEQHCGNCRFWRDYSQFPGLAGQGACRRFPPAPGEGKVLIGNFPITFNGHWCGEWEQQEVPPP